MLERLSCLTPIWKSMTKIGEIPANIFSASSTQPTLLKTLWVICSLTLSQQHIEVPQVLAARFQMSTFMSLLSPVTVALLIRQVGSTPHTTPMEMGHHLAWVR